MHTHMFWAFGNFSEMERMCAASFVRNGFRLHLWTYGDISNAPDGVIIRNARELIPQERVFKYRNGSYAGFANLFRYKLLSTLGGLYVDTDVVCLAPVDSIPKKAFLVSERGRSTERLQLNCNVICNPAPEPGDLIDLALAVADRFPTRHQDWGDCGPRLLTMLAQNYRKIAPDIMPPEFANPVDYWNCQKDLLSSDRTLPAESKFLHLYNEMWRRTGTDKNTPPPAGSIYGQLMQRHLDETR